MGIGSEPSNIVSIHCLVVVKMGGIVVVGGGDVVVVDVVVVVVVVVVVARVGAIIFLISNTFFVNIDASIVSTWGKYA